MSLGATPDFDKWAKGYSGCDGGNLRGTVWLCGIEWGLGKGHDLSQELKRTVARPPQNYKVPEDNLRYQYNVKAMKLFTAMRGRDVDGFRSTAFETPFPFHKESEYFKLNLFPIAFKALKQKRELWNEKYGKLTGLSTPDNYLDWCRKNRFPRMRRWVETGSPKLIIGTGRWAIHDFPKAFGFQCPARSC